MAAPTLSSPNGVKPVVESLLSLDQRKQLLSETLDKKVEQGYRIESQDGTGATVVTKGRRARWFGIVFAWTRGTPDDFDRRAWPHHHSACLALSSSG